MRQWMDRDVEVLMKEACTIQHQPRPAKQTAQLFAKLLMKGKVRATLWLISDRCMIKLLSNYGRVYTCILKVLIFYVCVCILFSSLQYYLTSQSLLCLSSSSSMSKRCCPPVPLLIVPLLSLFSWSSPSCCPPAAHPAQGHGRRPSCRWLYPGIEVCAWGWVGTSWNIDTTVVSHTWYVTIAKDQE